jgi:hypothetical protein
MSYFYYLEKEKEHPENCPYCGHSDTKSIQRKESTQEKIRLLRRVALKLVGGDRKKLEDMLESSV